MNTSKAFSTSSLTSACQILWIAFSLWLRQIWQTNEYVHCFMLPAPLVMELRENLIHGCSEPHGTISDAWLGPVHSPAFKVEQNLAPALSGLTNTILNGQKQLLAIDYHHNNQTGAQLVIVSAQAAADTVRPYINDRLLGERSILPAIILSC